MVVELVAIAPIGLATSSGSAVAEVVVAEVPVPMKILGVPGIFAPTGSAEFLLDEFGMSPAAVAEAAKALIARKPARA